WSESIRRLLIQTFKKNKIVSLPQTIYFSNTEKGKYERENTRRIYNAHSNLTIITRDPKSEEIAKELLTKARIFCMPDFVLSMKPKKSLHKNNPPEALIVLRQDNESFLSAEQRKAVSDLLPYKCIYFDTVNDTPIKEQERISVLEKCLDVFRSTDVVVTDRFHGVIFSIICCKSCVALRSIDHKLISGWHWFKDIPFVKFANDISEIKHLIEESFSIEKREIPDFNKHYFNKIPEIINWAGKNC
ncbi:MAG TPA: polysaccharide pyruvyl transferase, partial [bacterium]|nr:polysaccharide pyruvyl transferase [bacterium]